VDFNDDGYIDLISGDRLGTINYFRRLSNGNLTEEPDIIANGTTIDVGYNSAPMMVDWNEDGLLDLLVGNSDTSPLRIRVYLNSGTPSNYTFTSYSVILCNGSPVALSRCIPHVTDLNNDGKKDLVCGEDYGHVYYYENVGTNASPVFNQQVMIEANGVPIAFPSGYTDTKVWCNDWNEDGTKDIILGNYMDSVHLYIAYPLGVKEHREDQVLDCVWAAPNPFSRTTQITFMLSGGADVKLIIYDAQGRMVRKLLDQEQAAGRYAISWNGYDRHHKKVVSGVYFYRLVVNDAQFVDKLIVID
jgi:hypothetical protein